MEYIYIGDVVNTHGLKGEIRIISNFKYKDLIFKKGNSLYIGYQQDKKVINSYRFHKIYDMVTLEGINSIEEVIIYKGDEVYINREDFDFPGLIDEDLIGLDVYNEDKKIGVVDGLLKSEAHDILVINHNQKKSYIPYVDEFIINIDLEKRRMDIKVIEGLLNED
ncbi:MAG: ribosome maturation factor RimM [Bacilli bacterium]|nr:ribosome maturation factor RimM [Bacilli bacterium]MDD4808847.1 ribosome maturation factor RimM [Bacilli bacterium]